VNEETAWRAIRSLESRVRELEAEVARYKSDIDTTEAATGMSGIYAKLEAERDRLKEQCVRWEAMYEGMMAERDGLDADLFEARQAILTEGQIMMRLENEVARHAALVKLVTKIAQPISCGCNPCTGDCVSQNALQIYLDEIKAECKAALAEVKG